jgi:hypothetical protein
MGNDASTKDEAPLEGQLVRSKAWHAYQLKLAGLSLSEIAGHLNYTSGAVVAKAIKDEMISAARDIEPETRESLLDLEIERLNFAQSKIWMAVEAGDVKAIELLLKIVTLRAKLQGVDVLDASKGQQTVLVVGGSEGEYVAKLKLVAGGEQQD